MTTTQDPDAPAVRYHPSTGDATVDLVPDPRRFTVEFGVHRAALGAKARDVLLSRSTPVAQLAHYGIRIYEGADRQRRDSSVAVLNDEPSVELASPVLHRHTADGDEVYVTRRVLAQFAPDVTRDQIDALLRGLSASVIKPLSYADNGFLLLAEPERGGLGAFTLAERLRESGRVLFAHPDLVSRRHRRTVTAEPATATVEPRLQPSPAATHRAERSGDLIAQQWHLTTAKVTDAWSLTKGSASITVAVLDDGVDLTHPEFAGKIVAQYDFSEDSADGSPKTDDDKHGTACAGVAVAAGVHASGAAPGCSLMAVRFPAALGDSDEADMFRWAADNGADVISCSWGPTDGTGATDPLPGATQVAIQYCRTAGRNGKGIAVCWAAGNGNESVDADGYAANPHVMAIAALNSSGSRSWYSDMGEALWVTAPSSGDRDAGEKAIVTTDRQGAAGYNDGGEGIDANYTNSFGGTSSATPLVAGIVGLMLSANPDLTATQVRDILRDTATKVGTGYDAQGHSTEFGYGLVNAYEAVRHAQAARGQVTPAPGRPSIVGPSSQDRSGAAPRFEIDPGGGSSIYYAVEVATSASLLDGGDHTADDGFYGSWQDSPFQASNPYELPDAVWERMRSADRLYYRAWFSSSSTSWSDVAVTTDNDASDQAPSIELTGDDPSGGGNQGGSPTPTPSTTTAPSITGPDSVGRDDAAPQFELDPGSGAAIYYAVEVATDADLFDDASHSLDDGWYGSWTDCPFMATSTYQLPESVWAQLAPSASRLYYRAWFSESDSSWVGAVVTTDAANRADAPFITVEDGNQPRAVRDDIPVRSVGTRVSDLDELRWRGY